MIIQLSSGQGPAECELAVAKLAESLLKEFSELKLLSVRQSRFSDGYTSACLYAEEELPELEKLNGTIQWICQSPLRPHHKRKNWFVDVSVIEDCQEFEKLDEKDIRFERFHCGGNGGQNVNKVETGVRLVHIPTGIAVESTAERSQLMNRKDAMRKLKLILKERELEAQRKQDNDKWKEHNSLVRGNPVRVYKGLSFKRMK